MPATRRWFEPSAAGRPGDAGAACQGELCHGGAGRLEEDPRGLGDGDRHGKVAPDDRRQALHLACERVPRHAARLAAGTTWTSAVPGPSTYWSKPPSNRTARVGFVLANASRSAAITYAGS